MGSVKKKYVAKVGLDWKHKGELERHIEPGETLPDSIPEEDIQALLDIKAIEEKQKEK